MRSLLPLGLLFLLPACARAQEVFSDQSLWIHLNGYAHHMAAKDANDNLLGLGFTYYTRTSGRVLTAWEADGFEDSGKQFAGYAGYSWTVPTRIVSFGLTAAVMYHRNFKAQNDLGVLPVAFPYLETRGKFVKLRVYYVAPVRKASDEQVAAQLLFAWPKSGGPRAG
jgi:hypothetical protein